MKESADKNDGDTAPPPHPPAMSALYDDLDNMLYSMKGTHDQRELFQSLLRDTEKTGTPPLTGCAIPGIDMSDMNLRMVDLSHANMRKARLADMHIRYSRFNRARLDGASMQLLFADLTSFRGAVMDDSSLSHSEFRRCRLRRGKDCQCHPARRPH